MRCSRTIPSIVILASLVAGCGSDVDRASALATSLRQITAGKPIVPVQDGVWNDVHAFYEQRQGAAAWVDETSTEKAADVLAVLRDVGPAWPRSGRGTASRRSWSESRR